MESLFEIIEHTIMITAFVYIMMLIMEYINVVSSGAWQKIFIQKKYLQYLIVVLLGITPGCLGAFMVVAMYTHRLISLGALVATMIATSGDEAFVMLALIPKDFIPITVILAIVGFFSGILIDLIFKDYNKEHIQICNDLEIHQPEQNNFFPIRINLRNWKDFSLARGILILTCSIFFFYFITGHIGPEGWNWIRISILIAISAAFFIVATVPEHFLEEHLWKHLTKKHLPHLFFWVLFAFILLHFLTKYITIEEISITNNWYILGISGLVGLIPDSGPHMIFVAMYEKGMIPISILLANCIIQDGHGMLPLLACSRKDFILIKLINLAIGILIGSIALLLGY